jgi:hypothetical protein
MCKSLEVLVGHDAPIASLGAREKDMLGRHRDCSLGRHWSVFGLLTSPAKYDTLSRCPFSLFLAQFCGGQWGVEAMNSMVLRFACVTFRSNILIKFRSKCRKRLRILNYFLPVHYIETKVINGEATARHRSALPASSYQIVRQCELDRPDIQLFTRSYYFLVAKKFSICRNFTVLYLQ